MLIIIAWYFFISRLICIMLTDYSKRYIYNHDYIIYLIYTMHLTKFWDITNPIYKSNYECQSLQQKKIPHKRIILITQTRLFIMPFSCEERATRESNTANSACFAGSILRRERRTCREGIVGGKRGRSALQVQVY